MMQLRFGLPVAISWALALGAAPALGLSYHADTFVPGIEVWLGDSRIGGLALSPDGSSLFAAYWTDTTTDPVAVYQTANMTAPPTLYSGGQCHGGVAVSNNGRYVYTVNYYGGAVTQYDLQNGGATTSIAAGPWANSLWRSADGSRLLAGYQNAESTVNTDIAVISTANGQLTSEGSFSVGYQHSQSDLAFSSNGHVYISGDKTSGVSGAIVKVDLNTRTIVATTPVAANRLTGTCLAQDGNLYFAGKDTNQLFAMNTTTMQLLPDATTALGFAPGIMAMHPDQVHALISHGDTVSVLNLLSRTVESDLTGLVDGIHDIVFSQDGSRAYLAHFDYDGTTYGGITVISTVPEPAAIASLLSLLGIGLAWAAVRRKTTSPTD